MTLPERAALEGVGDLESGQVAVLAAPLWFTVGSLTGGAHFEYVLNVFQFRVLADEY